MKGDIPGPADMYCARCGAPRYHHEPTNRWACSDPTCDADYDLATILALTISEPPSTTDFYKRVAERTRKWEGALASIISQIVKLDADGKLDEPFQFTEVKGTFGADGTADGTADLDEL